jgi:hypothetical protein
MSRPSPEFEVFQEGFDFPTYIVVAAETGYAFAPDAFSDEACDAMEAEAKGLPMEYGDHITKPINQGKPHEVRQSHERYYDDLESGNVPAALFVAESLHKASLRVTSQYPELAAWQLNEAGYQNYRGDSDMIGVHRDRRNDELLSVTITVNGSARVLIHEPIDNPNDYKNTQVVDEFRTEPGSAMILRAPGLASGEQVLHQVLPPEHGSRLILNLRMRPIVAGLAVPKVLERPAEK